MVTVIQVCRQLSSRTRMELVLLVGFVIKKIAYSSAMFSPDTPRSKKFTEV
jgi:hypothetical protein